MPKMVSSSLMTNTMKSHERTHRWIMMAIPFTHSPVASTDLAGGDTTRSYPKSSTSTPIPPTIVPEMNVCVLPESNSTTVGAE